MKETGYLFFILLILGCSNTQKSAETVLSEKVDTTTKEEQVVEKYWKLITLNGKPVKMQTHQTKEVYFMLKHDKNSVKGFAGCNAIMGSYQLSSGNRIRFNKMATTLMFCPDIDENELLKVFELTDNYTIKDDVLSLNIGRRAPLAVFEAVYFH